MTILIKRHLVVSTVLTLLGMIVPAAGVHAEPVAIVEEIDAAWVKIGFMDYLEPGRTIALRKEGRLVVGYLKSCQRETIVGGTVTIGTNRSAIKGGKVTRERVECDGGQMQLTAAQAGKSGVMVMRKAPKDSPVNNSSPAFRIFSTRPVVSLSAKAESVTFTRLDKPAPALRFAVTGTVVDLADNEKGLSVGAIYRAEAGGRAIVFSVDVFANDRRGAKAGPAVGRLIRL